MNFGLLRVIAGISNPAGIYLLKANNKNTRTRCEICSKLKTHFAQIIEYVVITKKKKKEKINID